MLIYTVCAITIIKLKAIPRFHSTTLLVIHFTKILYYSTLMTVAYFSNIFDCESFQSTRLSVVSVFPFWEVCIFNLLVSKIQQPALTIFFFPSKIIQQIGYKFSCPLVLFCWHSHNLYAATGDSGKFLIQRTFSVLFWMGFNTSNHPWIFGVN
jgi:hypothetical protein